LHRAERFAALVVVAGRVAGNIRSTASGIFYPSIAPPTAPDPYAAVAQSVRSLPTWIFHGDGNRTVSVEESRRMFAALKSLGADVHYTDIPGAGHLDGISAAYDNADVIAWMLKQRRR
jgi:predicted peptidase